jgi:hypothetical protein
MVQFLALHLENRRKSLMGLAANLGQVMRHGTGQLAHTRACSFRCRAIVILTFHTVWLQNCIKFTCCRASDSAPNLCLYMTKSWSALAPALVSEARR